MGGMTLLMEAKAAGLTIQAVGGRLVIRGPRRAEDVALRLIEAKAVVMATLGTGEGSGDDGGTWVDDAGEHAPSGPWIPPLKWQGELAGWTDRARETWDERAAIMENDGWLSRVEAEATAFIRVGAMIREIGL